MVLQAMNNANAIEEVKFYEQKLKEAKVKLVFMLN
jgi:hypothetical protein